MHVTDVILISSSRLMITKVHIGFQANPISSFQEKVKQTDKKEANMENYEIDRLIPADGSHCGSKI